MYDVPFGFTMAGLSLLVIILGIIGAARADDLECVEHEVCENHDCDLVLCWSEDFCDGTEQPACLHHKALCAEHVYDCTECVDEMRQESDHNYARENGWAW